MFNQRKKGVKITDQRVRITTEVHYFVAGAFYLFVDWFEFGYLGSPRHPPHQMLRLGVVLYPARWRPKDQRSTNHQENSVILILQSIFYFAHYVSDRMVRAGLIALVTFIPILASILSFVSTINSIAVFWHWDDDRSLTLWADTIWT